LNKGRGIPAQTFVPLALEKTPGDSLDMLGAAEARYFVQKSAASTKPAENALNTTRAVEMAVSSPRHLAPEVAADEALHGGGPERLALEEPLRTEAPKLEPGIVAAH
jgi:hypothetical protein